MLVACATENFVFGEKKLGRLQPRNRNEKKESASAWFWAVFHAMHMRKIKIYYRRNVLVLIFFFFLSFAYDSQSLPLSRTFSVYEFSLVFFLS